MEEQYLYLSNIPATYHARELRNFFSQSVESSRFRCFHFRHRPELLLPPFQANTDSITIPQLEQSLETKRKSKKIRKECPPALLLCCILTATSEQAKWLIKHYHGMHWLDPKDDTPIAEKCSLRLISDPENVEQSKCEG